MTNHKANHARLATVLEAIPNVGASIARDLRSIGIKQPQEPDWPEPALPLPGLVRSNPHPAGPLRSRHLHLRRSLHGRSPRASVVVLHRGAKKEISRILTGAIARLPRPAGENKLSARLPLACHAAASANSRLPPSPLRIWHSESPRPSHEAVHKAEALQQEIRNAVRTPWTGYGDTSGSPRTGKALEVPR